MQLNPERETPPPWAARRGLDDANAVFAVGAATDSVAGRPGGANQIARHRPSGEARRERR
jgi:hypothetical protein